MKKKLLICLLATVMALCIVVAVACEKEVVKGEFIWDEARGGSSVEFGNSTVTMPTNIPEKAEAPTLMIHYWRKNANDYKSWGFWLWTDSGSVAGETKTPYGWPLNYQDNYGGVALYSFSELGLTGTSEKLGFIAKKMDDSWTKDTQADRFIDFSAFDIDENNYYHVYLYQGDTNIYKSIDALTHGMTASFVNEYQIDITTRANIKYIELMEGDTVIGKADTDKTRNITFYFSDTYQPDISQIYTVNAVFFDDDYKASCNATVTVLFETDMFNDNYNYDGELGAIYSPSSTTFKVWSPVSTKIMLNIYEQGNGGSAQSYEMKKGDKGVFEYKLNGNQDGKYYTYTVYNTTYPFGAEIVDPYAKSAGLNGKRGMVVNFDSTQAKPDGWDSVTPHNIDANELIVWETHVADVTSSATWKGTEAYRKKFLGMIEEGTQYTKEGTTVSTGFDHIKELGVNAVQLVPIFDQANTEVEGQLEFNWGYNPLNYNVLEGSYSTNAADGYVRIKEFRQLVQAFNGANINIIMDVVYNHVNSAVGSNFDVLMPGYYFRYTKEGDASNGSGCGNETASEHYMFRKFMIDSACFWAKEYKLGGFRFDLMGLHDIDTMNQLVAKLKAINPGIVVYGEPWTGGTSTLPASKRAVQANGNKYVGYGQFNDQMRDALIKGGMNKSTDKGWVTATSLNNVTGTDANKILSGLKGITDMGTSSISDMYKTVNYVTCHDNYTLKDRIKASGTEDGATVKKMALLANSVVFTSNGVNFMLAGEEFLLSKQDNVAVGEEVHNSYNASYKVNELNYELKVDNKDLFDSYVKLIAFKKKFVKEFDLTSNAKVTANYKAEAISGTGYAAFTITITAKDGTVWKIVHANGMAPSSLTADFNGYTLYLDTLNTGADLTLSAETAISPYQTIIAYKTAA